MLLGLRCLVPGEGAGQARQGAVPKPPGALPQLGVRLPPDDPPQAPATAREGKQGLHWDRPTHGQTHRPQALLTCRRRPAEAMLLLSHLLGYGWWVSWSGCSLHTGGPPAVAPALPAVRGRPRPGEPGGGRPAPRVDGGVLGATGRHRRQDQVQTTDTQTDRQQVDGQRGSRSRGAGRQCGGSEEALRAVAGPSLLLQAQVPSGAGGAPGLPGEQEEGGGERGKDQGAGSRAGQARGDPVSGRQAADRRRQGGRPRRSVSCRRGGGEGGYVDGVGVWSVIRGGRSKSNKKADAAELQAAQKRVGEGGRACLPACLPTAQAPPSQSVCPRMDGWMDGAGRNRLHEPEPCYCCCGMVMWVLSGGG